MKISEYIKLVTENVNIDKIDDEEARNIIMVYITIQDWLK